MNNGRVCCAVLLLAAASSIAFSQNASVAAATPVPVFRSESRLVLVDVVVMDKSGNPIRGLKAEDFRLIENGKPQKLTAVEEHSYNPELATRPRPGAPILPPNQYTNAAALPPQGAINIVLFDMLNTPTTDAVYARKELVQGLAALPAGHETALFLLSSRGLWMAQGLTNDPEKLRKAARVLTVEPGAVATERDWNSAAATNFLSQATQNDLTVPLMVIDRCRLTARTLKGIAGWGAAFPGRKNLIWITSDVPMNFQRQISDGAKATDPNTPDARSCFPDLLEAGIIGADSQTAIYPVSARGLEMQGISVSDQGAEMGSGSGFANHIFDQAKRGLDAKFDMSQVAEITGGRAFQGGNDVGGAIRTGIEQGENYYTLAYVPSDKKWNSSYRTLKVALALPNTSLRHRDGYFAVPSKSITSKQAAGILTQSLTPDMPSATGLRMTVQVLPPEDSTKPVRIAYSIASDGVTFALNDKQEQQVALDFMAIAWDKASKVGGSVSDSLEAALPPGTDVRRFAQLPARQELTLKPGEYTLALGVMDRATQKMGTLQVPIKVSAKN
jgi:VWFA-related protein